MATACNKTEPCVECPFTRDGTSGCITGKDLLGIITSGNGGQWPCHMEHGQPRERCPGAVLFARNLKEPIAQGVEQAQALEANDRVFTTKAEFIETYDHRPCLKHGVPAGFPHSAFMKGAKVHVR